MLAQLLVRTGRLEEAERLALESRESVGSEDRLSLSTTKLALGVVRAAQRRDEEAEQLMRSSLDELVAAGMRTGEQEALEELAAFLRERGRDPEAAPYEERLAALSPSRIAPIA
jgi:hypothetical protein